MLLHIDTHGGVPIYRQIMDQVRQLILTGQLLEGDRVEQVRALAARIKVNPMTVSKAYGYLEQEGLIERQRGVGLFVAAGRRDQQKEMKTRLLEEALGKAARSAIQMGVGEEEAARIFREQFRRHDAKRRRTES